MYKKFSTLIFVLVVAGLNILLLNTTIKHKQKTEAVKKVIVKKKVEQHKEKRKLYLSIIIDDIGLSFSRACELWDINDNITLSIIPFLKDSIKISFFAQQNNFPVMLHLPMEPEKKLQNYSHFLTTFSSKETFKRILTEDLNYLPYYSGINNHMGSKLTANFLQMTWFFNAIKNKNIFFVDSRTGAKSIAANLSLKYNILTGIRDVFIDNKKNENYILNQLNIALKKSLTEGFAIAIGHPHKETINALKKFLSENRDKIQIIPVKFALKKFKKIEIKKIMRKESEGEIQYEGRFNRHWHKHHKACNS